MAVAGGVLFSCTGGRVIRSVAPSTTTSIDTRWPIKQVIYVMMENRSFDNLFGRFPGVNGTTVGVKSGEEVALIKCPDWLPGDLPHDRAASFVGEDQDEVDAAMQDVLRIHRGLYAQLEGNELYVNGKIQIKPVQHEIGAEEVAANVPFGSVERVREQLRPYQELGVDHFSMYFDFGMPQARVLKSMRLFAGEVMPEFHGPRAGARR